MQGKALYFVLACALLGCSAATRELRQDTTTDTAAGNSTDSEDGYIVAGLLCSCDRSYNPVCGLDLQTYPNQCVLDCAGVPLGSVGKCDPVCYPPRDPTGNGGGSYAPICVDGLTFYNIEEALAGGRAKAPTCYQQGICNYDNSDGGALPITGGNGASVAAASANTVLPDPSQAPYDYSQALHLGLLFYESIRSGKITNPRFQWRGDSCFNCNGTYGEDLSAGFYESGGSFLKMGLPMAFTGSLLAWGGIEFSKGYATAGETDDILDKVRHIADYLMAANPQPNVFAAVLGNDTLDFDYFGPLELYERYVPSRPVGYLTTSSPGSEIVAEAAAALAATAILTNGSDPTYAASCLSHARDLYTFASTNPKSFMENTDPVIAIHIKLYPDSNGFADELGWAAAWLYRATGEAQYLQDAATWYQQTSGTPYTFEAPNKKAGLSILLAKLDPNTAQYSQDAQAFLNQYLTQSAFHTPKGAAVPYHWGGLRHAGNVAFLGQVFGTIPTTDPGYAARLFNYAQFQVDYILGASGKVLMTGYGSDPTAYPTELWHKPSYNSIMCYPTQDKYIWAGIDIGPWSSKAFLPGEDQIIELGKLDMQSDRYPQRHILYGAIMGSITGDDQIITARKDYTYTEVTAEYNAGWMGALAGMVQYYGGTPFTDEGLALGMRPGVECPGNPAQI